jgi:hypothetical protein
MSAVQPQLIRVPVGGVSAMSWLQSHWGQARRMELSVTSNVSWAMSHKAGGLITLNRLDLAGSDRISGFLAGWRNDNNPTISVLLAQL